ncbi:ATP-NAD/AcoX kinase [Halalkaliarchaeum desulfuricum]|uniref:ATP-NAD/AcoX kinase n=1 Tax=Halalkaliarchaeum desulfuricum TaxID=2055893 RepID=A0A343TN39_9EURY|nr:NAD(+)/NADH kinase [Halalkaliarchaeum desulfuricum]AUX10511.1 ATP-NAD/AcoX kinase [Halalkaliarchaeum desulfuricum]
MNGEPTTRQPTTGEPATVGLVVNPAAGRDIRRLVGGAAVSDNYAKRRTAECALAGLASLEEPIEARVMPTVSSIADRIVDNVEGLPVRTLDTLATGHREDTHRAAERLAEIADAAIVLGGDGTTADVGFRIGEVPVAAISTGTNNVVPDSVDGTVAGIAAGLVATGRVNPDTVTYRHCWIEASVRGDTDRTRRGLATAGVLEEPFVGTRAILDATAYRVGVVSRASPGEIGLSGIAGALGDHGPDDPGGIGLRFADDTVATAEGRTDRVVRGIVAPGVVERIRIQERCRLEPGETLSTTIEEGVLAVDGERDLELTDATVDLAARADGPRLIRMAETLEAAARVGEFVTDL